MPCRDRDFDQMATPTLLKIVVLGPACSGKSALVEQATEGSRSHPEQYIPTIGVDFAVRSMTLSNGSTAKFQLWDTAGQEVRDGETQGGVRGRELGAKPHNWPKPLIAPKA